MGTTIENAAVADDTIEEALARAAAEVAHAGDDDEVAKARAYLGALAPGGWLTPTWPKDLGGRGADKAEATAIRNALSDAPAPDLYPCFVGLNMVGPTLLRHGNSDQQQRFLPAIASGDDIWCQMFSEPDAGSDLANVAMRARHVEGGWTLTGQKTWTSRGHYASRAICLARTDPDVPKYDGLTMFVVDMAAPGIEVRPLVQINGDNHFSEVFAEDVFVADADVVGEVGEGWAVAHTVLAHERSSIGALGRGAPKRSGPRGIPNWLGELATLGYLDGPVGRDRAIRAYINGEVSRLTAARAAAAARAGRAPGPEGSGQKLRTAAVYKERAYLMKDAHGPKGMLTEHRGHDDAMTAPSMSIRGGTDEIQRNIVAEKVLGLPAEPRLDRDVPWARSRAGLA